MSHESGGRVRFREVVRLNVTVRPTVLVFRGQGCRQGHGLGKRHYLKVGAVPLFIEDVGIEAGFGPVIEAVDEFLPLVDDVEVELPVFGIFDFLQAHGGFGFGWLLYGNVGFVEYRGYAGVCAGPMERPVPVGLTGNPPIAATFGVTDSGGVKFDYGIGRMDRFGHFI